MKERSFAERESFLRFLSSEDREKLLKQTVHRYFKKSEQIVRFMDTDTNLYLIDYGSVRVTLFSPQGKEVSFVDIPAGGYFGEFAAIDGKPRSANVIALCDTKILILTPEQFTGLLHTNPEICMDVMRELTAKIRSLCDRIFEYSTLDVSQRIHFELARIAERTGVVDGVSVINHPPTHIEIASRVSCTREAVTRVLAKLEKSGIIKRQAGVLIVNDVDQLCSQEKISGTD